MKHLPFSTLRRSLGAALLVSLAAWLPAQSSAQAAAPAAQGPLPLADFHKRAAFTEMVASPNGRYLATTSDIAGRMNLVVIDLDERKANALTNYNNIDVGQLRWVGNDRILFRAIQLNAPSGQDSPRSGGLFVISRDGKEQLQLAKTARQLDRARTGGFFAMEPVATIPGTTEEMIVSGVVSNDDSFDLYRINLVNGRYRLLTAGRPSDRIGRWILDSKLVPRVAVARGRGASTEEIVYYRANAEAPWKELARYDTTKPPAFVPLAFDPDDKHLYVSRNEGRKNMAIFKYDPEQGKVAEMIAQHPQYDLGASPDGQVLRSLVFGGEDGMGKLVGIRVDADRLETVWLDEAYAKIQATLDATLPNRTNVFSGTGRSKRFLVSSYSDTSPGRFLMFDSERRALEDIGFARPWLEGKLASVRPFLLKTRDGLQIPSYYVLPRDYKPGTRLPTIVHIHGGPQARDVVQGGRFGASFGSREAQILASRGYAVVLPNFRVTPQLGSDIYYAGFGTYGKQMSDDHEDAAKWAVDQGFADPARMCISGASYGGYAALHAATRPTNPFACAISGLPVADLKFQHKEADYSESPAALEFWRRLQGVKDFDEPLVREMSPLFNAERIKVPVFMYIGDEDTRTPPAQARRMSEALEKAGNPVKHYFVGKGEGHGYGVEATNNALYEQMLKFLEAALKR
jgi:dipeptidyl aminopeptidase/acylaminoacyl peptidase